ncbi:hypothetical protein EST38_g10675 [Candolleomyces aberdarensis]|uniref:BTB domain-containing protein n=1 Tax=Candolleomyces aberdarensis TaxID=2316362 RepID=A0A4Q2D6T2_9AGAR|nr:hypothetical protein EST38_g10675 [Candolleomyces aberdarensis]
MTALINAVFEGERDEIYYWDTVKFLVEGSIFKVPRYQFVIGSTYFAEKLGSTEPSDNESNEAPVTLEGATASQFRVFLKLLFPIHTTSATLSFTKDEWLVVLELSTLWHFHEFRKLAKEHLEPQLNDPIEQIVLGRAAYVPKWVLNGYETLVARPECISEKESEKIGHLTTVRLYILRHECALGSVTSRFREEIHELEQRGSDHRTSEEKLLAAEEARMVQELAVKEEERRVQELRALEEAEEARLAAEEARIARELALEEEERRIAQELKELEKAEQERVAAEEARITRRKLELEEEERRITKGLRELEEEEEAARIARKGLGLKEERRTAQELEEAERTELAGEEAEQVRLRAEEREAERASEEQEKQRYDGRERLSLRQKTR